MNVNYLLAAVFIIGGYLIFWSYDIATQMLVYSFDGTMIPWVKDMSLGLGSGLVGSVVLIFGYDQVLRNKAEKDRKVRQAIAASKLYDYIGLYLTFGLGILNDFSKPAINNDETYNDFFNELYYDHASAIDLTSPSPIKCLPYLKVINEKYDKLSARIDRIFDNYHQSLNVDILSKVSQIKNSHFVDVIKIEELRNRSPYYLTEQNIIKLREHINDCFTAQEALKEVKEVK